MGISYIQGSKIPIGEREVGAEMSASKRKEFYSNGKKGIYRSDSDMIQDCHGWALDGHIEKEANMNKEIIEITNPSQSRDPEENEDELSDISNDDVPDEWTNRPIYNLLKKPRDSLTAEIFHKMEYTEQYDRNVWNMLINQLVEDTSHSNIITTKEAIKEFDDNNKMMNERLGKEDKTTTAPERTSRQGRLK
ncbi:hypothetical protein C1646_663185 [Rhizophagus diaphanus]|nr:hypothetical protein C1646_663185 [Rhizophagus diaphanus] [Rhizophagus sp. MUCL 43196]